ncbi:Lipid transfer protein [Medicago truncatula]|uniref:Lipid transfer protein n=1 Tax=Medicago truncatula TaxID=3880 RepID=A0A072USE2_MEDTR|nr:Lipid transfer protein [Medicago truncatula]
MEKVFLVLAFLLAFPSNALFAPTPTTSCRSIMNDMMVECLPYFVDHNNNSQPCCSAFESVAATASGCICDIHMDINNFPMNVTKMMKLPAVCGLSLPCHFDAPESYAFENLISSSSQSPSQSSPKPQPNHAPSSPASVPVQVADNPGSFYPFSFGFLAMIIFILFFKVDEDEIAHPN